MKFTKFIIAVPAAGKSATPRAAAGEGHRGWSDLTGQPDYRDFRADDLKPTGFVFAHQCRLAPVMSVATSSIPLRVAGCAAIAPTASR